MDTLLIYLPKINYAYQLLWQMSTNIIIILFNRLPIFYLSFLNVGYDAMYDLAVKGNDALYETHGKYYEVGCIPCVLYTATGTSLDWALGVAEVPYVYSIELRDTGVNG